MTKTHDDIRDDTHEMYIHDIYTSLRTDNEINSCKKNGISQTEYEINKSIS